MKFVRRKRTPQYTKYQLQKAFVDSLSIPKRPRRKWKRRDKWSSGVKKTALKGRCTSLMQLLAQPLPHRVRAKGENPPKFCYVRPSALKGKPTLWNLTAALPKLKHVKLTKRCYYRRFGQRQKTATNILLEQLLKVYNENHPPNGETCERLIEGATVHLKCWQDPRGDKKIRRICELSKKDRKNFQMRMVQMGQPKDQPEPMKPVRGPKKPLKQFQPALKKLAQPRRKVDLTIRDPFKVKPGALEAVATPWILELARHREPRPPAPVYDFRGNEILPPRSWDIDARRRVTASERTNELAIPKRVKKKAAEDVKEDPFMVSRAALKAVCPERTIELAKPVLRD